MDVSVINDCETHVCRTCLQIISKNCQIFKLDSVYLKRQLQDCVPGLNLDMTPTAVVCESCAALINMFHKFLTKCHQVDDRIDNYQKSKGNVTYVDLKDMMESYFQGSGFVGNHARNYVNTPGLCSEVLTVMVQSPDSSNILREDEVIDLTSTIMEVEDLDFTNISIKTEVDIVEQLEKDDKVESIAVEQAPVGNASVKTEIELLKESFQGDASCRDLFEKNAKINEESKQLHISNFETEVNFGKPLYGYFAILDTGIGGNSSNEPEQNYQEMNYNANQLPSASTMNVNENKNLEQLEICQVPTANIKVEKRSDMFKYKDSSLIVRPQNKNAKATRSEAIPSSSRSHSTATENNIKLTLFKCNYCNFISIYEEEYIIHLRKHTEGKPYKCGKCYYSSAHRLKLVAHMATHPKKSYQCDTCSYSTEDNHMFSEHVRSHEEEKQRNVMMTMFACQPSTPEPYLCTHCNYKAANKSILKKHMKNHVEAFQYKCPYCSFLTNGSLGIIRHVKTHTKPFLCTLCNYRTSAPRWLKMHKIKKHSN